jgi:hypothetical protein
MTNHLYYGDNLAVLRENIATASVDLVYLDPPFNSNASYNVLFKAPDGAQSAAQIEAFDDTWHWNDSAESAFSEVLRSGNGAAAEILRTVASGTKTSKTRNYEPACSHSHSRGRRCLHGARSGPASERTSAQHPPMDGGLRQQVRRSAFEASATLGPGNPYDRGSDRPELS